MATFFGKGYHSLKPKISTVSTGAMRLPVGIPTVPFTLPEQLVGNDIPLNDQIIGLDVVRNMPVPITGAKTCAVLIDTGVFDHPKLAGRIIKKLSANGDDLDVDDLHGHGTHMAGLITGHPTKFMGVAHHASLVSIKVTKGASGNCTWGAIYKALNMVLDDVTETKSITGSDLHPCVVNLSFNGLDRMKLTHNIHFHKIAEMIEKLISQKVSVVVSGGNIFEFMPGTGLGYPAVAPQALKIAASFNFGIGNYQIDSIGTFSQRYINALPKSASDSAIRAACKRFLLAPGVCSLSLGIKAAPLDYSITSGSSAAAAVVTGCVLILQQAARSMEIYEKGISPQKIADCLINGADIVLNVGPIRPSDAEETLYSDIKCFDNKKYLRVNLLGALEQLNSKS